MDYITHENRLNIVRTLSEKTYPLLEGHFKECEEYIAHYIVARIVQFEKPIKVAVYHYPGRNPLEDIDVLVEQYCVLFGMEKPDYKVYSFEHGGDYEKIGGIRADILVITDYQFADKDHLDCINAGYAAVSSNPVQSVKGESSKKFQIIVQGDKGFPEENFEKMCENYQRIGGEHGYVRV